MPAKTWEGERVERDLLTGQRWTVEAEHHGHTMLVLGRITRDGRATGIVAVECSCGQSLRMAIDTVRRSLARRAESDSEGREGDA